MMEYSDFFQTLQLMLNSVSNTNIQNGGAHSSCAGKSIYSLLKAVSHLLHCLDM